MVTRGPWMRSSWQVCWATSRGCLDINAFFHLKQTALWEFGDTGFEGLRHSINWDDAHGIIQARELILPGLDRT